MASFYQYCTQCREMFTDEHEWIEHNWKHNRRVQKKQEPDAAPKRNLAVPGTVPTEDENDRLAKVRDLRMMKKALKLAGIECQTLSAEETKMFYEKAKAEGKIK